MNDEQIKKIIVIALCIFLILIVLDIIYYIVTIFFAADFLDALLKFVTEETI